MRIGRRLLSSVAIVLATSAAGCRPAVPAAGAVADYRCGEIRVRVEYRGDSAFVAAPDTALALPIAVSASGARYSDGRATAWEHQGLLRLELPTDTLVDCVRE